MVIGLYAGSFDPIHLGHLGVVEQAAVAFDEVVVGVLVNPQKAAGLFAPEARVRLVAEAIAHLGTVRAVQFYGLTVALARREGATVLIRSAHKEQADELAMAATNGFISGIPTVLVPAAAATRDISSSLVRRLVGAGRIEEAQRLVPMAVGRALAEIVPAR